MIILDFLIDEATFEYDLKYNPLEADGAALQTTYFEMPVRFSVNNIELFEILNSNEPYLCLPILNIAIVGRSKILDLKYQHITSYSLPGGYVLNLENYAGQIKITSSVNNLSAIISHISLLDSFNNFRQKTKEFLTSRIQGFESTCIWRDYLIDHEE